MRKNHGSISSTDSGNSEAMSYCEGNVYHLTSSILHNAPNVAAPLPPRRHSAVQHGSNLNSYQLKQANGDISAMPPPPNPRTRNVPFPISVPLVPGSNAYNIYAQQHPQMTQLRHAGMY